MRLQSSRAPFRVLRANQFDLSQHQPVVMEASKKLMPTIIRLAELMAVADPDKQYKLPIDSQEELEVQILAFRHLVNERHFPLFGYCEDDEFMEEEIDQWEEGWIEQAFHPLLAMIPVRPMGFADHDIDPSDYGDLVALLYWLSTANSESTKPRVGLEWSLSEQKKFNPTAVALILDSLERGPPLTHLPGLIRTVLHQTDTFFLDACPLCGIYGGPDFSWTAENVIWFRDDWRIAKPIHEGNQELIRWTNNTERLAEISQILKQAQEIHMLYGDQRLPDWC